MNNKQLTQRLCIGIIIILSGIVILLDQLAVFTSRVIPQWYLVVIISLTLISFVVAIINKIDLYYYIAFLLSGLYLALTLAVNIKGISFYKTWPIILICLGIGIIFAQLVNKKSRLKAWLGALIVLFFSPVLAALWTNTWRIVLPILLVIIGLTLVVYSIYRHYVSADLNAKNKNYYVRPSEENNNKIDKYASISAENNIQKEKK